MPIWEYFNFTQADSATNKPKVAISSCLYGETVRYDGKHQTLTTCSTILSKHLQLLSLCPEVAAGMTVPRPPIQRVKTNTGIHIIGRDDPSINATQALNETSQKMLQSVNQHLVAYILKSKSPSCGFNSTPIFNEQGQQIALGSGLQAEHFQKKCLGLFFQKNINYKQLKTANYLFLNAN